MFTNVNQEPNTYPSDRELHELLGRLLSALPDEAQQRILNGIREIVIHEVNGGWKVGLGQNNPGTDKIAVVFQYDDRHARAEYPLEAFRFLFKDKYPMHAGDGLIECGQHRKRPWYMACVHVMNGAPVQHFIRATPDEPGEVLCKRCHERGGEASLPDVRAVCDKCVEARIAVASKAA